MVGLVTEEPIGKQTASYVVIARPNTKPEDVKLLKGKLLGDSTVQLVGPAKSSSFVEHSDKWLATLGQNEVKLHAAKLKSRLKAICTKIKKKGKAGSAAKLKTTTISFAKSGITLSNEFFSPGAAEYELNMLPIPYTYETKVGDITENKTTEVMCVWRAYIVDSVEDVEEDDTAPVADDDYDLMVQMLNGNTI